MAGVYENRSLKRRMRKLFQWLGGLWELIKNGFRIIGNLWVFIVTVIGALVVIAVDVIDWLIAMIPELLDKATDIVVAASNGTFFNQGGIPADVLAFCNTFLPLNEAIVIAAFLGTSWVAALGFRIIKSWIPTVN